MRIIFPICCWQAKVHPIPEKQAHMLVSWENESHNQTPHLPSPFPEFLLQSIMAYCRKCPFGQFGSTVPTVSLSSLMSYLWPTCWGGQSSEKKTMVLWKSQHWCVYDTGLITSLKYTMIWALLTMNSVPARPSTPGKAAFIQRNRLLSLFL